MRRNNKGFSYVELILVMAIIAIMIGLMSLTIGLVSRTNVNKAAEKLHATMNQARSTSVARGTTNGTLEISYDGSTYYYYVGDPTSADKADKKVELISAPAQIAYTVEGGTDLIPVGSTFTLRYEQATGAFKAISGTDYCSTVVIYNGDKSATIQLYPATGKCELLY